MENPPKKEYKIKEEDLEKMKVYLKSELIKVKKLNDDGRNHK